MNYTSTLELTFEDGELKGVEYRYHAKNSQRYGTVEKVLALTDEPHRVQLWGTEAVEINALLAETCAEMAPEFDKAEFPDSDQYPPLMARYVRRFGADPWQD